MLLFSLHYCFTDKVFGQYSRVTHPGPFSGPYVQGLTWSAVSSFQAISQLMDAGTAARTVAATAMNNTSSRAHTMFQIKLTQTEVNKCVFVTLLLCNDTSTNMSFTLVYGIFVAARRKKQLTRFH